MRTTWSSSPHLRPTPHGDDPVPFRRSVLNAQSPNRSSDHQVVNLLSSFKNVVGPSEPSAASERVLTSSVRPRRSVKSVLVLVVLVPN